MYDTLVSKLEKLRMSYVRGVQVSEEIFDCLKLNKIKELPAHTTNQSEYIDMIKKSKQELIEFIKEASIKAGIDNPDYKLSNLIGLLPQSQKERLLDLIRAINSEEIQLQSVLYRNKEMLTAIMTVTEAKLETAIEYNENELHESQLFLNEKF